jgi:hypothetical protein
MPLCFLVEIEVGPEVDIDAYAESTGRERDVDEIEVFNCADPAADSRSEGYELWVPFEASLELELVPSSESFKLEAKLRSKSSNSLLFLDGNEWILTSKDLSFSKW